MDELSASELSWFAWQKAGQSINEILAGHPTPAMYLFHAISSFTYGLRVLPWYKSHFFFPPSFPLRGTHTPAKPQLCLYHHDPFPLCDSLLSLMESCILLLGKCQVHAGRSQPVVSCLPTGGSNSCGGVISGLSGSFSSPWYPTNYPTDVECIWVIHVAEKFHIELVIPSLK